MQKVKITFVQKVLLKFKDFNSVAKWSWRLKVQIPNSLATLIGHYQNGGPSNGSSRIQNLIT